MPATLNNPVSQVVAQAYDVLAIELRYDLVAKTATVIIVYSATVNGNPFGDSAQLPPMSEAAFLALAGASPRLKALNAVVAALNPNGGAVVT